MAKPKPAVQGFLWADVGIEEWEHHWKGMPDFTQEDLAPVATQVIDFPDGVLYVHFEKLEDKAEFTRIYSSARAARPEGVNAPLTREWFSKVVDQDVATTGLAAGDRKRTQSIWYPEAEIGHFAGKSYVSTAPRAPRFPIYIPSKGRADSRLTAKQLDKLGVPYIEIVEPQEADAYLRAGSREDRLLILPEKGRGLVYVRNWIWDRAEESGVPLFWTMDDNIMGFYRLQKNLKTPVGDLTMMYAIEEMTLRYENVGISGMNYFMFASRKTKMPPLYINSRVYSNMLLRTDYREADGRPFRNDPRLRFNDDTDLNLRVLKRGHCTLLFNAFLIFKAPTMTVKGGMAYEQAALSKADVTRVTEMLEDGKSREEIERAVPDVGKDHRWQASWQLKETHPAETTVVGKWGRWHHSVDYSAFRKNRLIPRPGVVIPETPNEYGMELRIEGKAAGSGAKAPGEPHRVVKVHFETEDDIRAFSELMGQRVTYGTRAIWWPEVKLGGAR